MTTANQPFTSHQNFYFGSPLYEAFTLSAEQIKQHLMESITVDGFCPYCRRISTFRGLPGPKLSGYNDLYFTTLSQMDIRKLSCARNQSHVLHFYLYLNEAKLQKIGQYPSFADIAIDESKEYARLLSKEDAAEFHKALGLAAHGIGIGSFIYLRRIFERLIEKRFNEFKEVQGWDEEEFRRMRMSDRIELLSKHLPEFLVRNKKIYSILSLGVHELDEKQCLAFFPVLRTSTVVILEQDKKKKEELARQEDLEKSIAAFEHPETKKH